MVGIAGFLHTHEAVITHGLEYLIYRTARTLVVNIASDVAKSWALYAGNLWHRLTVGGDKWQS